MHKARKTALLVSTLTVGLALVSTAYAEDKMQKVDEDTTRLLTLMDKDQNGKVSKDEFMKFMSAEFDRLDKDKSGELDVDELTRLHMRPEYGHVKYK